MKCGARFRKPAGAITDRAKRYRANQPECRPEGPRLCMYCGSGRNVEVHHLGADESDIRRSNLAWACRSCNTRLGLKAARAGRGKRTRQYNLSPAAALLVSPLDDLLLAGALRAVNPPETGAAGLGEYVSALRILHGELPGNFAKARQTIHNTPPSRRRSFAAEIWRRRRKGTAYGSELVRRLVGPS